MSSSCIIEGFFTDISVNYNTNVGNALGTNSLAPYQYQRYVPNYFRYPDTFALDYKFLLQQPTVEGRCLRQQLITGQIKLYSAEQLFVRLCPLITDDKILTNFKDRVRNEFIAFCLNIEKTNIFYYQGKKTCPMVLPHDWQAVYDIVVAETSPDDIIRLIEANTIPISVLDQTVIYNLSVAYITRFTNTNRLRFNFLTILKIIHGTPVDPSEETQVNFYELIYMTFILLSQLCSISKKLMLGLDPGLPPEIITVFFPPNRQRYYYNLYITWIQTRNKILGFGDQINVSNGDGTYIPVPGVSLN